METELETYNRREYESANAATGVCRSYALHYAPLDTDAATFAALHLALEIEASRQGIKFRLLFGCENS